ncbi:hypothetical protein ISCGN_004981 [Ixodes scapularis]
MQTRHRAAADQGETGEGPDPTSMDLMARVANLCDTVAQRLVLADHGPQGQGPRPQVPVPLYTGYDDRKSVADFLAELAAYKLATGASDEYVLARVLPVAFQASAARWWRIPTGCARGITVVVDSDATERGLTDVSILEERAVARAILLTSFLSFSIPIHILTDSQTACWHFLYNTLHPSAACLLDPFLSSTSHTFRLARVLGHAAVPGNECAHALVRELSHRALGEQSATIRQPLSPTQLTQLSYVLLDYFVFLFSLPLLADRASYGLNSKPSLYRRPSSTLRRTPPAVRLNACTAAIVLPSSMWSGNTKPFPLSHLFPTPLPPPGGAADR